MVSLKTYEAPTTDLVSFENDQILTESGTCRCYLDIGVKDDYSIPGTTCWTDSEDASAYDMHDAPIA